MVPCPRRSPIASAQSRKSESWRRSRFVQCPFDLLDQFVFGIGFLKYLIFAETLEDLARAVASDEDDRQHRTCGLDRFSKLEAAHFRHGKIRKNEFNL